MDGRHGFYVPMHLYTFFSFFYAIRFAAKAIASIENSKNVDIAYYGTYMAGLFFFPIGIWWIQPKINRILRTPLREDETTTRGGMASTEQRL